MMRGTKFRFLRKIVKEPLVFDPTPLAGRLYRKLEADGLCTVEVNKGSNKWTITITEMGIEEYFELTDE